MTDRQQLGQQIAKKFRAVRRVNQTRYSVKSQSVKGKYDIYKTDIGWTCSCPDHKFRGIKCKHILVVEFSYAIRETVREEVIISATAIQNTS
jgi:SWIM zinc finger